MTATPDNARNTAGPIPVGLIATPNRLEQLATFVQRCPNLDLRAQAGMPQSACLPDVPWVDDTRVLVGQRELQAVLLATSTADDVALSRTAAGNGLHVWRLPPLADTFAEAVEHVRQARKLEVVYRVASWWEHVAEHAWHDLDWPAEFQAVFSEVLVSAPEAAATESLIYPPAVGGALPNEGYALLEALVALRGLPESATGLVGRVRDVAGRPSRQAEDAAIAVLRYDGGGMATVRASRGLPPAETRIVHHGRTATVCVNDEEVVLTGTDGAPLDRRGLPNAFLAEELTRFSEAVRGNARDRAAAPLDRHVATSAVLEAIHLSARTGQPESPARLYAGQGWPEPER